MTTAKTLIPNKSWIIQDQGVKIGSICKDKKGYAFFNKGKKIPIGNLSTLKEQFGEELFSNTQNNTVTNVDNKIIYDYPCKTRPHSPVYNIRKKLPIYSKSLKSKSLYCAGYYLIKFKKGWTKAFCPKLITLERYEYQGPYKTEDDMRKMLTILNKI